jgi:hypothetical protein
MNRDSDSRDVRLVISLVRDAGDVRRKVECLDRHGLLEARVRLQVVHARDKPAVGTVLAYEVACDRARFEQLKAVVVLSCQARE